MSVETNLDSAFTILLGKARSKTTTGTGDDTGGGGTTTASLRPAGVDFEWSGGGQTLDISKTDPVMLEVPFTATLVWAHVYAFDGHGEPTPVTAVIEFRFTKFSSFGGAPTAVYGSGSRPSLSGASSHNADITGWITNFDTGDTLVAYPSSYEGAAVGLVMTVQLRPVENAVGVNSVTDAAGNQVVDSNGEIVVTRS